LHSLQSQSQIALLKMALPAQPVWLHSCARRIKQVITGSDRKRLHLVALGKV